MELYLVRHGQSFNNSLSDVNGRVCDPPLTEVGEAQAQRVAEHLRDAPARCLYGRDQADEGYGITRLVCSPMLRALQTADAIGRATGLAPEVWIDVHEEMGIWLDGSGPLPGMTRREILSRFPDCVVPEAVTDRGWWNRPAETEPEWHARAARVVRRLKEEFAHTDQRIAIVNHGGFTRSFLAALLNGGPWAALTFSTQNTSIGRIDFLDGEVVVRYLNRIEHLPPELVT